MYYVYFLELSNKAIYVGSTSNLKLRISRHEKGEVATTRNYAPFKLKSYIAVESELGAKRLEKYFKTGSGKAIAKKRFIES